MKEMSNCNSHRLSRAVNEISHRSGDGILCLLFLVSKADLTVQINPLKGCHIEAIGMGK